MDYGWDGNKFVDMISSQPVSGIYSGFFIDPGTQRYFYEQNYNSFFNVALIQGIPAYQGNGQPTSLAPTILSTLDALAPYISDVGISIQLKRQATFDSDPNNIINTDQTTPSAIVDSNIKSALATLSGNQTIINAIHSAAPYLSSSEISYALTDILQNWVNGPDVVAKLSDFVNSHQEDLDGINKQIKSIADFKKKLLRQQTMIATKLGKAQGDIHTWETSNTFTMLASAFPGTFQPLVQALSDHKSTSQNQMLSFMPSGSINLNQTGVNILSSLITGLFGSFKPRIIAPIDKIMSDLNKLEGSAFKLTDYLNINHYIDTNSGGVNVITQFANVIDAVLKKVPPPAPQQIELPVDPAQLGVNLTQSVIDIADQQLADLLSTYSLSEATRTPTINSTDFTQLPEISQYLDIPDPTMNPPTPSLTTDPVLQQSVLQRQNDAQAANAANSPRHIKRGSGINILLAVDMTPINEKPDGTDGDYSTEIGYGV